LSLQVVAVAVHTHNVDSAVAELVGCQQRNLVILEPVEHKQLAVLVALQEMDIQELTELHTKVEIQRMKAAVVVVATSAAVVVVITTVAAVARAISRS
jgi:hypothetical protein